MLAEIVLAAALYAIDGDTLALGQERIRLENVDTPEIHPCRCESECALGLRAAAFTQQAINAGGVLIERTPRTDRYGRTIARVYINGRDLGEMLIAAGLGRPYHGERRRPWC
jgi:endonuclease YncB( thermonuclease family)